jgi:uncharacterized membrane protein (DUF485 family)
MAISYKTLGQVNPGAATETTLYTVPGATSTVCSTVVVCNQGTATTFRVYVRVAGLAATAKQYLFYDTPISANTTLTITIGMTLAATDVVSVYTPSATMSFNLFGQEIT